MIKKLGTTNFKRPGTRQRGVLSSLSIIVPKYIYEVRRWRDYLLAPPTSNYLIDLENLIIPLKSTGLFYQLDKLGILATEQQQHARVDLIDPTATQITEVNSPTWTANLGYKGDGSTKYLNTNATFANSKFFTQNSASFGVYILENIEESGADIGATHGANRRTALHTRFATNTCFTILNESGGPSYTNTDSRGMYVVKRNGTIRNDYKNGVNVRAFSPSTSEVPSTHNVYLLGRNENGALGFPSTRRNAMYFWGSGDIDHTMFYNIFQDFAKKRGFAV